MGVSRPGPIYLILKIRGRRSSFKRAEAAIPHEKQRDNVRCETPDIRPFVFRAGVPLGLFQLAGPEYQKQNLKTHLLYRR